MTRRAGYQMMRGLELSSPLVAEEGPGLVPGSRVTKAALTGCGQAGEAASPAGLQRAGTGRSRVPEWPIPFSVLSPPSLPPLPSPPPPPSLSSLSLSLPPSSPPPLPLSLFMIHRQQPVSTPHCPSPPLPSRALLPRASPSLACAPTPAPCTPRLQVSPCLVRFPHPSPLFIQTYLSWVPAPSEPCRVCGFL